MQDLRLSGQDWRGWLRIGKWYCRCSQGSPTLATEFFSDQNMCSTTGTHKTESGPAFFTELDPLPIGRSTFCTLHKQIPLPGYD